MRNNIPARVGMPVAEVDTPCLMVDLDAFERNVDKLGGFMKAHGLRHRAHAKTHKSSDIADRCRSSGAAPAASAARRSARPRPW